MLFRKTSYAEILLIQCYNWYLERYIFSLHSRAGAKSGKDSRSFQTLLQGLHGDEPPEKEAPPADCQTSRIKPRSRCQHRDVLLVLWHIGHRTSRKNLPASYGLLKKIDLNLRQDNKSAWLRGSTGEKSEETIPTPWAIPVKKRSIRSIERPERKSSSLYRL